MHTVIQSLEALDPQLIVVVDSPPILLTSEARVLASLFGQVVMVVRAGVTPQQAVLDAIKHIGDGAQINLVLNQALHVGDGTYDSYGYGARYGDGEGDAQPKVRS
jgi:receptor protein-tyrosine kinase